MSAFESLSGLITLERALEHAREGRPDLLLMLIGDAMGADVADTLVDYLKGRIKLQKPYRGVFLPREAEGIRTCYEVLKKRHPKKSRDQLLGMLVDRFAANGNVSEGTFADIIDRKNTYSDPNRGVGEQTAKRSPPWRKK